MPPPENVTPLHNEIQLHVQAVGRVFCMDGFGESSPLGTQTSGCQYQLLVLQGLIFFFQLEQLPFLLGCMELILDVLYFPAPESSLSFFLRLLLSGTGSKRNCNEGGTRGQAAFQKR